MRFWDWGVATAEAADWHFSRGTFRTEYGPWGYTTDMSETDMVYDQVTCDFGKTGTGFINEELLWILKDQVKAKLGQVPVLISASIEANNLGLASTWSLTWETRRMITTWDKGDTTNWRYDKSGTLYWYNSLEHIVRGQDVETTPSHSGLCSHTYDTDDDSSFLITDIVSRALRDNTDIKIHLSVYHALGALPAGLVQVHSKPTNPALRPYIRFAYLYPIEFYHDDGTGNLDLSSPVTDDPGDEYYIGAVEPGQTGTATKCHIRNYSESTQQVEIFDDHPEFTTPITRIGSSQLDYCELSDAAVSQLYTPTFYSATQYEVKAEAYRDNSVSLHPTINADASWRGDTSTDFTAPSGGLTIPAAAWQRGTATSDEYEFGVRGNTTDTGWPADSNDQVEITYDNAGSADATAWRPILGRREETRAQVTVDATTKFFPTRGGLVPADWPTDNKAFVMDGTKMNEGEVSSVSEANIGADSFTGSGLDDITVSGNFNGTWDNTLRIRVDGTGTPDTFEWSIDGGGSWEATDVDMSTSDIHLQDGIYVRWAADTGHTLADYWDCDIDPWGITLKSLTANSNVYNSGSRIGTTLPLRDVTAATFTTVSQDSGVSQGLPARLYVNSTTGFSAGQDVFIQAPGSPDTAETLEIDSVGSGFLDLTTSMTQDYVEGDFVTRVGSGEEQFWARPVATAITTEEVKQFRLNARML
jgi:hypothetical protein